VRRRVAAGLIVAVALCAGGGRARAFSRYQTAQGKPFFWQKSCVVVTVYLNGFETSQQNHLGPDAILKSVAAAAEAWSPGAVSCGGVPETHPYLEIVPVMAPEGAKPPPVGDDARNTIVFRTENWSESGRPDGAAFEPKAAAVTHVHAAADGHITDADIELNGVSKDWANLDPGAPRPGSAQQVLSLTDLQNALTHEFGHLLGLEHTCFKPAAGTPDVNAQGKARWTDDQGRPVPDCETAPAAVRGTVMFDGDTLPEDISRRTLSPDETAAACSIYAATNAHQSCDLDNPPGCSVSARPPKGPVLVLVLVAVLVPVVTARRRSRP
jgi:hypothetical protein